MLEIIYKKFNYYSRLQVLILHAVECRDVRIQNNVAQLYCQ